VAEELRARVSGIDETAFVHNAPWSTFCDGAAIGNCADWDE
jgi:hypothetical protein